MAITDGKGRTARGSTTVIVNPAPVPDPPAPTPAPSLAATVTCTTVTVGTATACNVATLTYGGAALGVSRLISFYIDWGDGSAATTGLPASPAVVRHTYAATGTYQMTGQVAAWIDEAVPHTLMAQVNVSATIQVK